MGTSKKSNTSMKWGVLDFSLVVAGAVAVAILANLLTPKYMPKVFLEPIYAAIVVVSGYMWIRISNAILERVAAPTIGITRARGIKNFFEIVIAIIIVVVVFAIFHFDITGILVGAGFIGIVLGLAAQQVLGNIFAGISLVASRPFDIGDRITLANSSYSLMSGTYAHENQLNGFTGVVNDIGIFFTQLMLDDGTPSVFPNSVVVGSMIVNHTKISLRTVRVRMDLDKRLDYNSFKSAILDSLKKYDLINSEKSRVEIVDIGATTYQVVIIVWAKTDREEPIKTLIIQEALKVQREQMAALK